MIEVVKSCETEWNIYHLYDGLDCIGVAKWRVREGNADIHLRLEVFKKSYLRQIKYLFNTMIMEDAKKAGAKHIVAVASTQNVDIRKLAHFWQVMGFDNFCAVQEVL